MRGNDRTTRAQNAVQATSDKVSRAADRYTAAWTALLALDPNGAWKSRLREIKSQDLKNPSGDNDEDGDESREGKRRKRLGEGHRDISWIWTGLAHTSADAVVPSKATDEEVVEGRNHSSCILPFEGHLPI